MTSDHSEVRTTGRNDASVAAFETLPPVSFADGAVLIEQGCRAGALYFLLTGRVQILKDTVPIAEVAERGAVFGEMSVLLDVPHTATVKAMGHCTFGVANEPARFLEEHPEAAVYIGRILAQRLDALNRYLVDVKSQFKEFDDHLGLVDEVLDTLMHKHPRRIPRRDPGGP